MHYASSELSPEERFPKLIVQDQLWRVPGAGSGFGDGAGSSMGVATRRGLAEEAECRGRLAAMVISGRACCASSDGAQINTIRLALRAIDTRNMASPSTNAKGGNFLLSIVLARAAARRGPCWNLIAIHEFYAQSYLIVLILKARRHEARQSIRWMFKQVACQRLHQSIHLGSLTVPIVFR